MVAHFISVLLTGFTAYVSKPGSSLFSWHPTLMTFSYCFFMVEGILFFSRQSSILTNYSRKTKSTAHWIMMIFALISMALGTSAIYINKNRAGKPHFTSWHGVFGLITVILTLSQAFGGLFQVWGRLRSLLPKDVKLGQLKGYHATFGLLVYLMASATVFLGMQSAWFTSMVTGTSWYACAVCPVVLLMVVSTQVTTAYLPQK